MCEFCSLVAGLVNTIFCKNTLASEVSTYLHPPQYSSKKWRSNKGAFAHWGTPLKRLMLWVDHEHLRPKPPTNHPVGMNLDWDHLPPPLNVDLGLAIISSNAENAGNFLKFLEKEDKNTLIQVLAIASKIKRHSKTPSAERLLTGT